ncbi:oxidoreductase, partial [Mycobacterium tuberculosis]|nr:oxidoreductase [Mycobacterium tuberculosis]
VFDRYQGRPHWGKRHFQTADTLRERYPHWDRFAQVRTRFDPGGLFANEYLARVLGPIPS